MGEARNGVELFAAMAENVAVHVVVARAEKVAAQHGVAVRDVVAQGEKAEKVVGFEVAIYPECQMKVVTFVVVVVVVTTDGWGVVAPAALTDRTAQQDWGPEMSISET